MKAVILAGGLGTRLSEETMIKPKPMVEIGGNPILWHIMKIYSHYNINEFVICLGYKGYVIKEYFSNYFLHQSDVTYNFETNQIEFHTNNTEPWKVTLIDTGINTMTGGRLKRIQQYIGNETFCFTYGDGVSDVNINELIRFHKFHKKKATLTAVVPPGRYGALEFEGNGVGIKQFVEKPQGDNNWINGGFFVLEPEVFSLITDDKSIWELGPLEQLVKQGQLAAYKHYGFWQPMDTLREKARLEELWNLECPPWKVWK